MSSTKTTPTFDPYPETIYIYDNSFESGGAAPDREELEQLRIAMFGENGQLPDIVWDGISNPEKTDQQFAICVNNGDSVLINVDSANNAENVTTDMQDHTCDHERLGKVILASN